MAEGTTRQYLNEYEFDLDQSKKWASLIHDPDGYVRKYAARRAEEHQRKAEDWIIKAAAAICQGRG